MKLNQLLKITIICFFLAACEQPPPKPDDKEHQEKKIQDGKSNSENNRPGFAETAAHSAIAGASAGAAGTLAHHATNGAVKSYQKRKRIRRYDAARARRRIR